ncbi:MAG: 5-oxoprolinase subunit PxpB [Chloroflexota bacterium]|nr:5-oxoprolinase subunit PxpB [Chloroflexota bacterium]
MSGSPGSQESSAPDPPRIRRLGDATLRVELATEAGPEATARVVGLTAALDEASPPGLLDLIPAYTVLLVVFDPALADPDDLEALIYRLAAELADRPAAEPRRVRLPVAYGGEFGPDLGDVAAHASLSSDEVIARHAREAYLVACLGFAPGFPFLMGLPPELAIPRLPSPRTRTPVGSVAIGGVQTGVYPLDTPGGWRVIGRTPVPLFDLANPDPFLLRAGDRLSFAPISPETYAEIAGSPDKRAYVEGLAAPGRDGRPGGETSTRADAVGRDEPVTEGERGEVRVLEPGLLTTVQDLGRPGLGRYGVTTGGAVDRASLILGNRLVGNPPGTAGLEITLLGPRLRFAEPAVIAVTGADLGATVDGGSIPCWEPVPVPAGGEIAFSGGDGRGVRAYLCVAGGIDVPPVLGSRSADLTGRFGGVEGRPLQAGDALPLGRPATRADDLIRRRLATVPPAHQSSVALRCTLGPQEDRFNREGMEAFLRAGFTASTKADRMGVRLTGPMVELSRGADMLSEGIAPGAVQVPGDGQPIALLTPRHTVGGYPKIATVIGPDLDKLAQVRPGDTVTFAAVDAAVAREMALAYHAALGEDAVTTVPRLVPGVAPLGAGAANGGKMGQDRGGDWGPAGVVRVIEAARAAGVTAFRLEVAGAGLKLELRLGRDESGLSPGSQDDGAVASSGGMNDQGQEQDGNIISAPMLGVFYRRPGPDQPPMAEPGQPVEAGQAIGLIEVMKTYHEVTAPRAGVLAEFLAEDGAFVEYGAPIARLGEES